MALEFPHKTPYEEKVYGFRLTRMLAGYPSGTTVVSAAWTVEDGDEALVLGDSSIDNVLKLVLVMVTLGTSAQTYLLRCKMVLSDGSKVEFDATITVNPIKPY